MEELDAAFAFLMRLSGTARREDASDIPQLGDDSSAIGGLSCSKSGERRQFLFYWNDDLTQQMLASQQYSLSRPLRQFTFCRDRRNLSDL
jgi:hypothetical protein